MEQFVQGQRLTANKLNSAFEKVGGPMNPSNDYQWTKTDYGNLQTTWNTFIQSKNQNPDTLEIGVGYSTVGQEQVQTIDGITPKGLRRVFINVGSLRTTIVGNRFFNKIPNIGDVNSYPFIGIIALELHRTNGVYLPGDGKIHYSVFNPELVPQKGSTPQQWLANQKLWQTDVDRGADARNWWYTGITLERHTPTPTSPELSSVGIDFSNDLICFPFWALYTPLYKPSQDPEACFPIMCVMMAQDFYAFSDTGSFPQREQLAATLANIYPRPGFMFGLAPSNNINLRETLGNYVVSETNTQNAYYRTNLNYIRLNGDTSPWQIGQFDPVPGGSVGDVRFPQIYSIDWIDDKGIQHGFKQETLYTLSVMNLDGSQPDITQPIDNLALACGWHNGLREPVLSCVAFRITDTETNDTVNSILSGLFNEEDYGLSTDMQKRLIWINRLDTYGVQMYDTCPDFRSGGGKINISAWDGHEIDTADNVSNLVLSSRSDSRVEWDLVDLSGKWRIDCGIYYV